MYNYSKLLGRIKEKNMTQEEFAKNIGINPSTLSGKLNSTSEFRQSEMEKGMMILDLPLSDICEYFFSTDFGNTKYKGGEEHDHIA